MKDPMITKEPKQPRRVAQWWLSFCRDARDAAKAGQPSASPSASLAPTQEFLGAVIVPAESLPDALFKAIVLECDPGGHVMGQELAISSADHIGDSFKQRLLSMQDCMEIDRELGRKKFS
jgi:hypothetical protein